MLLAKGDWRLLLSSTNYISLVEFNKIHHQIQSGYQIFKSQTNHFQCFSADEAEAIFSGQKSEYNFKLRRFIANPTKLC